MIAPRNTNPNSKGSKVTTVFPEVTSNKLSGRLIHDFIARFVQCTSNTIRNGYSVGYVYSYVNL